MHNRRRVGGVSNLVHDLRSMHHLIIATHMTVLHWLELCRYFEDVFNVLGVLHLPWRQHRGSDRIRIIHKNIHKIGEKKSRFKMSTTYLKSRLRFSNFVFDTLELCLLRRRDIACVSSHFLRVPKVRLRHLKLHTWKEKDLEFNYPLVSN